MTGHMHTVNPSTWVAVVLALVCMVTDLRDRRIPNYLTLPAAVLGLLLAGLGGWKGLVWSVAGMVTGVMLFLLPYHLGGMGAGDVKLMGALGALVGFPAIFDLFIYTALAGGLIAVINVFKDKSSRQVIGNVIWLALAVRRRLPGTSVGSAMKMRSVGSIPYGVAIAFGTLAFLWFGHVI